VAALQPVRGTHDLTGDAVRRHRHVLETARAVAHRFGHSDIEIPIFEFTPIFARSMGEGSDVVRKEMYTFADRGGEELTLRPEATAGIARAFISGGMRQHLPLKFFTAGPMFRDERPQKGRQRQFHHIVVEILGVADPQADIEVIAIGAMVLKELGVLDKCVLQINTLGDPDSRRAYRDALVGYFSEHKAKLSEDSLDRLERNPLRILDSKDRGDQALIPDAPRLADYLNPDSAAFFEAVKAGLDALDIRYQLNERLVRGLDYYTHTAFEFVTDALGAQGAVIAGGRYDGLIKALGGPNTPGIGWAGGIERLALLIAGAPEPVRPIALIPMGAEAQAVALPLAQQLRAAGLTVEHGYSGNLKRRLKRANAANASLAVLLGEDELAQGVATVRDLDSGEQRTVPLKDLLSELAPGSAQYLVE
jgi:histidyl-tRNA synthetase